MTGGPVRGARIRLISPVGAHDEVVATIEAVEHHRLRLLLAEDVPIVAGIDTELGWAAAQRWTTEPCAVIAVEGRRVLVERIGPAAVRPRERRFTRAEVFSPIRLRALVGGRPLDVIGRTLDLSIGGCLARLRPTPPTESRFVAFLDLGAHVVVAGGTVRDHTDRGGVRCEFTEITDEHRAVIAAALHAA